MVLLCFSLLTPDFTIVPLKTSSVYISLLDVPLLKGQNKTNQNKKENKTVDTGPRPGSVSRGDMSSRRPVVGLGEYEVLWVRNTGVLGPFPRECPVSPTPLVPLFLLPLRLGD